MKDVVISVIRPFWKVFKFLVLRPYYDIKDTWIVWNARNHKERTLQKRSPLPLSKPGQEVLNDLHAEGISITHINTIFPNSTWFEELTQYAEKLREHSSQNKTKPYWMDMWDIKNYLLDLSNPFLRFSLEPEILSIANAYMGMYSKLHSVGLSLTIPVEPGTPARQSQRWHRDIGNKKYFKAFLYLNDIEKEDGPFIYVKGSQPGGKWDMTFPSINPYSTKSGRVDDTELEQAIPSSDIVHCTGRAGTLVFADTTGLHKGGYSTRNTRFASITTYYSWHSLELRKYRDRLRYSENFDNDIKELIPQAQFAIKRR